MAAVEANTTNPDRHLANFPPSPWGGRFLSFSLDNSEVEAYSKALEGSKEDVRKSLTDPTLNSNEKLSLIYSVHRLGLTYLFSQEIDAQLDKLFNELCLQDYDDTDLYNISLHFQAFRHHGYKFSCDVFNKFKDGSVGTFKDYILTDVRGLLSFYECTHLRISGESILDEALAFTETKLKKIVNTLEGNLATQVKQALTRPFHRGIPLVEARLYFSNYQQELSKHESLSTLAKVHFNYLQLLHKEELRMVSQWWKDMEFQSTTPYTRDRVPESYLWILGCNFEPRYSEARIIATKVLLFVLVLDDTCDAYATIEEIRLIIDAINKWELSVSEQLPEYIKPFYKILLNEYQELERKFSKRGRAYAINASKQAFQELARSYLKEAEWTHSGHVASFHEYMLNGLTTSAYNIIFKSFLAGMGEISNEEDFAWFESHPKTMNASELIARLQNDVVSFRFERERGQSTNGVNAYIKTFGVLEEEAIQELTKMIENTWKDINEGCLMPMEVSKDLLLPILNLTRMIDVAYRYNDEFTFSEKIFKEYITLLFIEYVSM